MQEQPDLEHRDSEMCGDQLFLEPLLDGQSAERGLEDDQAERGQARPEEEPVRAVPPPGGDDERRDQDGHGGRHDPVRVLDDHVRVDQRHDPAVAERPALGAAAARTAAQTRVADPHDSTDHDQQEGEAGSRVGEPPEPA